MERFAVACASLVVAIPATAGEIPVGPGDSIQAAIDGAVDGDEIVVSPGVYLENIDFLGKQIVVRSTDGSAVTTIDGTGLDRSVVTCASGEGPEAELRGFTITGGSGTVVGEGVLGLGMYVVASSPTVRECRFVDNLGPSSHDDRGGGVYCEASAMLVEACRFVNNRIGRGGGVFVLDGTVSVLGCEFECNEVSWDGGGVGQEQSEILLEACTFISNHSDFNGGGVSGELGSLTVRACTFVGNAADFRGGAIHDDYPGSLDEPPGSRFVECEFHANGPGTGSGIYGLRRESIVARCTFTKHGGSVIHARDGRIESCWFGVSFAPAIIFDSSFSNEAEGVAVNCVFAGNGTTGNSGVIRVEGSPLIVNCTIVGNTGGSISGVQIRPDTIAPRITNTVIWSNSGAAIVNESTSDAVVSNCLIEGSGGSGPDWNDAFGIDGGGNVDADPMIADFYGADALPGSGDEDMTLLPGSPCIERGDDAAVPADAADADDDGDIDEPLPFDVLGAPRFVGAFVDIGAVEFQGDDAPCPDTNGDGEVGVLDLVAVVVAWGTADPAADVDGDGTVGVGDLIAVITGWGSC